MSCKPQNQKCKSILEKIRKIEENDCDVYRDDVLSDLLPRYAKKILGYKGWLGFAQIFQNITRFYVGNEIEDEEDYSDENEDFYEEDGGDVFALVNTEDMLNVMPTAALNKLDKRLDELLSEC